MKKAQALGKLSDGHAMYTVEAAEAICEAFNLTLDRRLIVTWTGQADANPSNDPKGLWLNDDGPGAGVASLSLASYVARQLKADTRTADQMMGRGFRAKALADAIAKVAK